MTTSDWHLVPDPQVLDHFGWQDERLSQRKRFLFMAAVGRHIAALMTEPECVRVVEACEEFAEGVIDVDAFSDLHAIGQDACWRSSAPAIGRAANDYVCRILDDFKHNECIYFALDTLAYVAATEAGVLKPSATYREAEAVWQHPLFLAGKQAAERTFLGYMHDVFGPDPYEPLKFDPSWRTDTVESIARSMYASRDFSGMPVLADALQESGCENPDILRHCRDPHASHVRGCWVVDLVLGKK
jgi:hypothetical protein